MDAAEKNVGEDLGRADYVPKGKPAKVFNAS